jgi:DNA-binding XRE family transcriptional regulator
MGSVQGFPPGWNMTDFHQRLRRLRTARKLTQTRVAELLGVSPRVYTRWENGDATPTFTTRSCTACTRKSISSRTRIRGRS